MREGGSENEYEEEEERGERWGKMKWKEEERMCGNDELFRKINESFIYFLGQ